MGITNQKEAFLISNLSHTHWYINIVITHTAKLYI